MWSAIIGALIGGFIVVAYSSHVSARQEKALLQVFVKEFLLLFGRCSMYYGQMLKGVVSLSTLYQTTDATTITKLAEVTSDHSVIDKIILSKANFFQVTRWAERSSRIDPETQRYSVDGETQSRAIVFFMGELKVGGNSFGRVKYQHYKEDIEALLSHLEKLNTRYHWLVIPSLISKLSRQQKSLETFIQESRRFLNEKTEELESFRQQEREFWEKEKGMKFD